MLAPSKGQFAAERRHGGPAGPSGHRASRRHKSTETIRTPDSLAYDLRYAHQSPGDEGGRRIVIATDRPVNFWEASNQPRVSAAKGHDIELENFGTSPVMLSDIEAAPIQ